MVPAKLATRLKGPSICLSERRTTQTCPKETQHKLSLSLSLVLTITNGKRISKKRRAKKNAISGSPNQKEVSRFSFSQLARETPSEMKSKGNKLETSRLLARDENPLWIISLRSGVCLSLSPTRSLSISII